MTRPTQPPTAVATVGAELLSAAVEAQAVPVERVSWQPPMDGTAADLAVVATDPLRRDANERAVEAVLAVQAVLVDVAPASEVLGLHRGQFLHAGPPIAWERTSGPLRGALMGAAALEALVDDPSDAAPLFEAGRTVSFDPCHHRSAVGPMAGGLAVDVDVRARGPRLRSADLLLAQRGARQGAEVRRLRAGGARPAPLDVRRARPAPARRGARHRAGRRHRDPHPDAPDGRRGAQPQPRRHLDAPAGPRAGDGRLRPARRRRRGGASGSSAATTTSSSTSRCPPASSPSTPPAASRGRRWWSRWPATAPTSGSR